MFHFKSKIPGLQWICLQFAMKTMPYLLCVLSLCVVIRGLTLEQLCPEPLEQAPRVPWAKDAWPDVPSTRISYTLTVRELPNNSFVFGPEKEVH